MVTINPPIRIMKHLNFNPDAPLGKRPRLRPRYDAQSAKEKRDSIDYVYFGIDGEGQGREEHKYVLLACSDASGTCSDYVENFNGLSTVQCLEFILNLPLPSKKVRVFSYSFNYDLTKMLVDLPNEKLYKFFRPELRQRPGKEALKGPIPVKFQGYELNLQGTKFTLRSGPKKVVIWDLFKFYQSSFVNALIDWKVGDPDKVKRMKLMKDKRAEFDKETPAAVRAYCLEECQYMAELGQRLVQAHEAAGLELKSFYGAGSSGSAMLKSMGIQDQIAPEDERMKLAVASSFFGGRFENSVIGSIKEECWNYDISSAYPYQLTFLPCLIHGKWRLSKRRSDLEKTQAACVHYTLHKPNLRGVNGHHYAEWAPFPYRTVEGSICYPSQSAGGWVWKDEFLAGERLFPNVEFREAWLYSTNCDCKPFSKIPHYYAERVKIGKEGPGIVIKLGSNSCYGKLAQSVGNAIFNSWIWAGIITSGCRAQALDVLGLHKNWSNLLMIATDGVYTREKIVCPRPMDTGTFMVRKPGLDKNGGLNPAIPLGGWEEKKVSKGLFVARPGIYFPMDPTVEELKDVRGRGVGKGVVLENWRRIIESWNEWGTTRTAEIANVSRFCGGKSSISQSGGQGKEYTYKRATGKRPPGSEAKEGHQFPSYGQWITRPVEMSFDPMPKRRCINPDGLTLKLRGDPMDDREGDIINLESSPYKKSLRSQEHKRLKMAELERSEQPDGDVADYEMDGPEG